MTIIFTWELLFFIIFIKVRHYLMKTSLLQAKREIYSVMKQRLDIAQEEMSHLNSQMSQFKASRTSCE